MRSVPDRAIISSSRRQASLNTLAAHLARPLAAPLVAAPVSCRLAEFYGGSERRSVALSRAELLNVDIKEHNIRRIVISLLKVPMNTLFYE